MAGATDLVLTMIGILESIGVPYMLVGSYSSNYYGRPRLTNDADFVVAISDEQLRRLGDELPAGFHLDRQMGFETVTMHSRYVLTHSTSAFRIELFLLADDPYHQERFRRRHRVDFEGHVVWLPTAEDVIIQKLSWAKSGRRSKDIEDAKQVLRAQAGRLDFEYIRRWCNQQGTVELLEGLTASESGRTPG